MGDAAVPRMFTYKISVHILYLREPEECTELPRCLPEILNELRAHGVVKLKYTELLNGLEVFADEIVLVLHDVAATQRENIQTINGSTL